MIFWEAKAIDDRMQVYEYLYSFNPKVAEQTDDLIARSVSHLAKHPEMGVVRRNTEGRLLVLPEVSLLVSYVIQGTNINILRVLHEKQQFP